MGSANRRWERASMTKKMLELAEIIGEGQRVSWNESEVARLALVNARVCWRGSPDGTQCAGAFSFVGRPRGRRCGLGNDRRVRAADRQGHPGHPGPTCARPSGR